MSILEALEKWKEEPTEDSKSTFGIRLSKKIQFEIKCAAKASGKNISEYIETIHKEYVKEKDYSLLEYVHDSNNVVRLLKLAFLFPGALSITEKIDIIDRIRARPEFWVDPIVPPPKNRNYKYPRVEDNIPKVFVIIKNYHLIKDFVRKHKMPIKDAREVVYGKEPKTGAVYEEEESYELDCQLKPFEKQIEDKYIEIFKILKEMQQTGPSRKLHEQYCKAYSEFYKLLGEG